MIVAVSHAGDDHLAPVLEALRRRGARAVVADVGAYPERGRIALSCGGEGHVLELPGATIRADEVEAVWWRRPRPLSPGPLVGEDASFALRQSEAALSGFWAALRARWVNDPWREDRAAQKPLQLAAAERAGLAVARTLVTNDPRRARAFLETCGPAVHKALHATPRDWRPTAPVRPEDVARLETLRLAPAVLQEYVEGVDVRVTVAGEVLHSAAIDARATPSPHDFRPVYAAAGVERCELPGDVAAALLRLVRELGLAYAAVDLRRRDDGSYVFLEANPSGQWLFVEERTGQPITDAVAALLAGSA